MSALCDVRFRHMCREETGMLRWPCGITTLDRMRNETIKGTSKVEEISSKVIQIMLSLYGHKIIRKEGYYIILCVMAVAI